MVGRQRWELLDPRILTELSSASPDRLTRIAVGAAAFAASGMLSTDPVFAKALQELQMGRYDAETRAAAERRAIALDDLYFELSEAGDGGSVQAFARARAAAAVVFAYEPDPALAAPECIYETLAATDDVDALVQLVIRTKEASVGLGDVPDTI